VCLAPRQQQQPQQQPQQQVLPPLASAAQHLPWAPPAAAALHLAAY
jgi:hypothetical protein